MKLRQTPEDFVVEEIPLGTWASSGKYAIYSVTKTGMTSFLARQAFARHVGVNPRNVGMAGLKDKHARTTQFFSAPAVTPSKGEFTERIISSKLVGYAAEALRTGDLVGNRFTITVRQLNSRDVNRAQKNEAHVRLGVPNYFDSQRFGSLKGTSGFVAKDILCGYYESAVKKILTGIHPSQPSNEKACRKFIGQHWGKWKECIAEVEKRNIRAEIPYVLNYLIDNPTDFVGAFRSAKADIRELYFSAYQSFVWNQCVKKLVKKTPFDVVGINYEAGKLYFPRGAMPNESLKMVSADLDCSVRHRKVIDKVLANEKVTLEQFKNPEHLFVSRVRETALVPAEFSMTISPDERNAGTEKAVLKFVLPKGSYATVIVKALFEL